MASTDPERREEEEEAAETAAGEEEDTGAQVAPIVKLEEVAVTSGEEEEDVLLDLKSKLYRYDKEGSQWKERGTGTVKLLNHRGTGKVRLVMRQSKTLKICANHLVLPSISIQEHAGNDKSCLWHAKDFSEGEVKDELFCIRFASIENCKKFKEMVEEVAESQRNTAGESQEATSTANLLERLSVEESKDEEKTQQEVPISAEEERDAKKSEEKEEKKEAEKPDADK
ncbi:PREDICTED: ran-binding protein 1 homolog b-like [Nelumbo nucifera]|uniref:Ran-binding protein 1 homolog b-like n=1 Tax=Nelumbo nucifera TaxID=4432 RepID=A0A1U7ZGT7_NELNU|nr:PREDICTED: ran-binding protein 1 homolog b-like [Nelumbo nucifera]